jgi:AraC family transcriptional regulator of adaptative response / DNA-3-methyladenine glycosylase II
VTITGRSLLSLSSEQCQSAAKARDPRFDGVFFIGVTTTGIYCRPICPTRLVLADRRRFFISAAAAERAGYRPCLRCRPELAPGRAPADAVSRLAVEAAMRISSGALNEGSVADLARDLKTSERHLRRALEREAGVSPLALAQTHRLLLAKRLLADTDLSVTSVAFASGFQSLRRFNTVFRERYHLSPSELRRAAHRRDRARRRGLAAADGQGDALRLTLAYRTPFAWDALLRFLARDALPGVELVADGERYTRTVRIEGRSGVISASAASTVASAGAARHPHLDLDVSASLLPALMPLLSRLRRFFDLDAQPTLIDAHLAQRGLAPLVAKRRGLRLPGALEPFEVLLGSLLRRPRRSAGEQVLSRVVQALGEPLETTVPALDRLAPTAERVAAVGTAGLRALGVSPGAAVALSTAAEEMAAGRLILTPSGDLAAAHRLLLSIDGISDRLATWILLRTSYWPDAFPASDPALQRAAGATGPGALRALAERWRPWRGYAALHLWLEATES